MKKNLLLTVLLLVVLLCGCSTMRKTGTNMPTWYLRPQSVASGSEIAFVGEGTAENERQAQLLAYSDLYNKLYSYLGLEPKQETFRELSTEGQIKEYALKLNDTVSYEDNGIFHVFALSLADKKLVQNARSDVKLKESEIEKQAKDLILEGDELIKNNMDLLGAKKYIQSMLLTYQLSQIEREYSFAEIFEEVLYIINTSSMTLSQVDEKNISCTLTINRKASISPSKIIYGPIKATYQAFDSLERQYEDSFVFATREQGTANFTAKNISIVKQGRVDFVFDFDTEINELAKVSKAAADGIRHAVDAKKISFEYSKKFDSGRLAICILTSDLDGLFYYNQDLSNNLKQLFDQHGAICSCLEITERKTDKEIIETASNSREKNSYVLICRVGVNDWAESKTGNFAVSIEGYFMLVDLKTGKTVFNSDKSISNGFGTDLQSALDDSCNSFVSKIFSVIKVFYV